MLKEDDLRWANLSDANLSYADMSWANLMQSKLKEANMSGANFNPDFYARNEGAVDSIVADAQEAQKEEA